jgi:lipopolysaccharide/colanic/teichoic acid biosynthesis glycosyltransferase
MGRSGIEFGLLKFRTMTRGAGERHEDFLRGRPEAFREWQRVRKVRSDPRVTRMGRILRRCSLDEVPQLINVIRGEMSLVGPRPVVREELERFGERAALVLSVTPGMTGLWAVNGRNEVSYEDRVELECRYVREWSLRLDLRILLRTVPMVLGCRGAY